MILKIWNQDMSNEGSNFILNLLENCHWVAETGNVWQITDFTSYKNFRMRHSEFTKFWPRAFQF